MEPSEVGTVVLAAVLELVVASALALLLRMRLSAYTAALRSCLSLELAHIGLTTVWLFVQAEADRAAGASAAADATLAEATAAGQNVTEATRAAQAAAQMALSTLYASNSVRVSAGVCDGLAILLFAFAELEYWQQIAPFAPGITVKGVRWGKTLLYFSAPLYVATAFKPVMKQPIRQWMFTFELCVTCFFCVFDVAQSLHLLHVVFRRIRNVSFVFQVRFAFLAGFALIILIIGAGLHGYNDNVHPQYLVFSDLTIPVYIMCFIGTMQMPSRI
nr:hypothetical protein HK105_008062 [Polyrhizophydium stewartii]